MGKFLNLGNDGFKAIRNGLYIDKTGLIAFINSTIDTAAKSTCVSRPRRFGKSFAARMLSAYYDRSCDSRKLFQGLKISKDPSFKTHLNKYDVIYLDMTLFKSISDDLDKIVSYVNDAVVQDLQKAYPKAEKSRALAEMMLNVVELTNTKFVMVIDEWDALFREAQSNTEIQKEYITFLRGLFKSPWTDKIFAAIYITGILPIKKYGTQSAMTDFTEYTMLNPGKLTEYVGFTESEVQSLCTKNNFDFDEAKRWYDGYSYSDLKSIYNPNSVIEAIKFGRPGSYWTQTETYLSLQLYIEMNKDGLQDAVIQMLNGSSVKIDAVSFQNDMTSVASKDDILTLLVHLGYLAYNIDEGSVRIPNDEIRQEFIRALRTGKHKNTARLIKNSDRLIEAIINLDEKTAAECIEETHDSISAPNFYNDEQALRSVIRISLISCADEFVKIEELPSGHGYADLVFIPKKTSNKPVLVVELKWNKTSERAIEQIKNRKYPQILKYCSNDILLVGISYDEKSKKHSCKIEQLKAEN